MNLHMIKYIWYHCKLLKILESLFRMGWDRQIVHQSSKKAHLPGFTKNLWKVTSQHWVEIIKFSYLSIIYLIIKSNKFITEKMGWQLRRQFRRKLWPTRISWRNRRSRRSHWGRRYLFILTNITFTGENFNKLSKFYVLSNYHNVRGRRFRRIWW